MIFFINVLNDMINQSLWWPSSIDFTLIFEVEGVSNFTKSSSHYYIKSIYSCWGELF
jgi:hypothetical protein